MTPSPPTLPERHVLESLLLEGLHRQDDPAVMQQVDHGLDILGEDTVPSQPGNAPADWAVGGFHALAGSAVPEEVQCLAPAEELDGDHVLCVGEDGSALAKMVPIMTWSSLFAEVGMESTHAECDSTLFCETSAAAVYWAIMKPEFRPESGSPLSCGLTSLSMRRSDMLASSVAAMQRQSAASARGKA